MLDSISGGTLTIQTFLICMAVSVILGIGISLLFMFRNTYTKGFVVTLAILPAIVSLVIMMVNGSIGTGVAVAGAFSLVRFRSVPGNAREISSIFFAMALGLAIGMGYVVAAALFFVVIGIFMIVLSATNFGESKSPERNLKITIPENLDYDGLFDDIFQKYTTHAQLMRVKTTSLGTLYELHYKITLRKQGISKEFLDELRCRNGNLNIVCGRKSSGDTL